MTEQRIPNETLEALKKVLLRCEFSVLEKKAEIILEAILSGEIPNVLINQ